MINGTANSCSIKTKVLLIIIFFTISLLLLKIYYLKIVQYQLKLHGKYCTFSLCWRGHTARSFSYIIKWNDFECNLGKNWTSSQICTSRSECNSLNEFNLFQMARKIISFDNNQMGQFCPPPHTPIHEEVSNREGTLIITFITQQ